MSVLGRGVSRLVANLTIYLRPRGANGPYIPPLVGRPPTRRRAVRRAGSSQSMRGTRGAAARRWCPARVVSAGLQRTAPIVASNPSTRDSAPLRSLRRMLTTTRLSRKRGTLCTRPHGLRFAAPAVKNHSPRGPLPAARLLRPRFYRSAAWAGQAPPTLAGPVAGRLGSRRTSGARRELCRTFPWEIVAPECCDSLHSPGFRGKYWSRDRTDTSDRAAHSVKPYRLSATVRPIDGRPTCTFTPGARDALACQGGTRQ